MNTCIVDGTRNLQNSVHVESILERAKGEVELVIKLRDGQTVLRKLRQSGLLKCLFPRSRNSSLEAVLLNCAGGVTGGDHFSFSARTETNTTLTLTTQAAERIYRALPGEIGRIETNLEAGEGARINWLPQETILFDGCSVDRSLKIDLHERAELLMVEQLIFGRFEMGEVLNYASVLDCVEIRRSGIPIYVDRSRLLSNVQAQLDRPGIADGAGAIASLVYVAPDVEQQINILRQMLPNYAGASLIHENVMVIRLLGKDSKEMRSNVVPLIKHLNDGIIPKCWML